VKGGAGKAVQTAAAQLGKPYEWAADGPDSYDCSGLTMYAWGSAGVSLPHSSQAQYSSLPHVARSQIQPGDLLFYGSPIHHVGIYEGGGVMINAPETGENVRRDSISRADYVGAARP
jgi:cell wall-associated NlpC family hydrolase